jgi:quercetin dioxygenase-like cupin family protein
VDESQSRRTAFPVAGIEDRDKMAPMAERELVAQLRREGFSHTYVWEDGPNAQYGEHTHAMETAHVVLQGELTLTMNGSTTTYYAGERCDVPANVVHSAQMGPRGCRYLIGER